MFPYLLAVRFVQDGIQCALVPLFIVGVSPVIAGLGVGMLHLLFVFGFIQSPHEIFTVAIA